MVLSSRIYNVKSNLPLVCPITSQVKGYPFEVEVPSGQNIRGAILADHLKSVDWRARHAGQLGLCPAETLEEIRARLAPLLGY